MHACIQGSCSSVYYVIADVREIFLVSQLLPNVINSQWALSGEDPEDSFVKPCFSSCEDGDPRHFVLIVLCKQLIVD